MNRPKQYTERARSGRHRKRSTPLDMYMQCGKMRATTFSQPNVDSIC